MRKKSTNEEKVSTNEPQKEKSRGKGADDGGKRRSGKDGSGKHTGRAGGREHIGERDVIGEHRAGGEIGK